jgi:hypothetical protein
VFQSNTDLHRDEQFLQLKLNYRGASLSQGEPSLSTTLQPGDRAPDAPLLNHLGKEARLFDLFRGPHFTVLGFLSESEETADQYEPSVHCYDILRQANGALREHQFIARDEHIWNIYGVASSALFLLRPDGYIGFIGHPESASRVKDYLRKFARE